MYTATAVFSDWLLAVWSYLLYSVRFDLYFLSDHILQVWLWVDVLAFLFVAALEHWLYCVFISIVDQVVVLSFRKDVLATSELCSSDVYLIINKKPIWLLPFVQFYLNGSIISICFCTSIGIWCVPGFCAWARCKYCFLKFYFTFRQLFMIGNAKRNIMVAGICVPIALAIVQHPTALGG